MNSTENPRATLEVTWIATFVMIAIITVSACIEQEKTLVEKSPMVVAMGSN